MATRAAMVQHQARRDNMADVAAKDNSQVSLHFRASIPCVCSLMYVYSACVCLQETVVNLAGLLVNLWLTPLVAGRPMLVLSTPTHAHTLSPFHTVWSGACLWCSRCSTCWPTTELCLWFAWRHSTRTGHHTQVPALSCIDLKKAAAGYIL